MNIDSSFTGQLAKVCSACMREFNQVERLPKILPACGHKICSSCLDLIFITQNDDPKCPFDSIKIEVSKKNSNSLTTDHLLLMGFNQSQGSIRDSMLSHQQIQLTEEEIAYRKLNMADQGHSRPKPEDLQSHQKHAHMMLAEQKKGALNILDNTFQIFQDIITKREEEIWSETVATFLQQKVFADERFESDIQYKAFLNENTVYLSDILHEMFFHSLEQEIADFKTKIGYDNLVGYCKEATNNYHQALNYLDKKTTTELEDYQPVFPSIKSDFPDEIAEAKVSRMEEIFRFEMDEDWLVISPKLSKKKNGNSNELIVLWGGIEKVRLDFEDRPLSKAFIQALYYIWKVIGPIREIKMNLSNTLFTNVELDSLCFERFWISQQVERVEIALRKCKVTDEAVTRMLVDPLTKLPSLKHFSLNLKNTPVSDISINMMNKYTLPAMMGLETFQLYLSGTHVTDKSTIPLCYNVKYAFTKVKTFNLCLRGPWITNSTIFALTTSFSAFTNLENLTLSLYGTKIDDLSLEKFSTEAAIFMNRLRTLSLNLSRTEITGKGIEFLSSNCLSHMNSLENFSLYLSETQVTDSSMKAFFKKMNAQKKALKTFAMTLNKTKIGNCSIKALAKHVLPYFTALENFTLDLFNTVVTDKSIQKMCTNMKAAMKNVKEFSLGLVNTNITDKSITALATTTIPTMQALKSFTIGLLGTKVTDTSIVTLWKKLTPVIVDVKTLIVELGNTKISDISLKEMAINILPVAVGLRNLTLGLSGTRVGDGGIVTLSQHIKELDTFTLALGHTVVTDQGMTTLAGSMLPFADKLQKFEINLHNTKTSANAEVMMGQMLQQAQSH